jgi:hypothetical protein
VKYKVRNQVGVCTFNDYETFFAYNSGIQIELASYHAALKLKYERAARYPWLSPAPDPPLDERQ